MSEPTYGSETCWICGKRKGQPPLCNGHYDTPKASDWADEKATRLTNVNMDTAISRQCATDAIAAALREARAEVDMDLRKSMFLYHSCIGRYGDDGEMQCNKCGIDFKRDSFNRIMEKARAEGAKAGAVWALRRLLGEPGSDDEAVRWLLHDLEAGRVKVEL